MAGLVVGGLTIPVAVRDASFARIEAVDRAISLDNTYRTSATGGVRRDFFFRTPPVVRATADIYAAQLSIIGAQMCSGDIISLPTMCCAEITNPEELQRLAVGHAASIQFTLHEVQPAKTLLRYAPGDTISGESFARSTTARQISLAGVSTSAAVNAKRDSHYVNGVRSTLLEKSSTNLVLQSENFGTTWTLLGTPTRTAAWNTASGVTLDLTGDDSAAAVEGYEQVITFTGDGIKAVSVHVDGSGSTTSSIIRLRDNTAGANRLLARLTWSGGLPVIAMTTGAYFGYEVLASGVFRLLFQTASVTAANSNQIANYPATDAALAVANTGNLAIGGVQAENAILPSSYAPTTTGTFIRASDSYSLPITFAPMECSIYCKFIELGTVQTTNARLWEISDAGENRARLYVYSPSGTYVATHGSASADTSSGLLSAPAYRDVVEILVRLFGDGSVDITQSINGAASTSGPVSSPNVLAATWSGNLLWLNSAGTTGGIGFAAYQALKIVAGARSLAEMRVA